MMFIVISKLIGVSCPSLYDKRIRDISIMAFVIKKNY